MRRLLLVLILALLVAAPAMVSLTAAPAGAQATFKHGTLTFTQGARRVTLRVEVADTPASRSQGLMHRTRLAENTGMLFIFEETGTWGFWMKNTLIPLSIAFLGEDWRVVDIVDMDVAPNPEQGPFKIYESAKPFRYALEVNRGFLTRKGLTVGARASYTPAR